LIPYYGRHLPTVIRIKTTILNPVPYRIFPTAELNAVILNTGKCALVTDVEFVCNFVYIT